MTRRSVDPLEPPFLKEEWDSEAWLSYLALWLVVLALPGAILALRWLILVN